MFLNTVIQNQELLWWHDLLGSAFSAGYNAEVVLHRVPHHWCWKVCHKPQRVIIFGSQHCAVVEGNVGAFWLQLADEGGLPIDLARAEDASNRGVAEGNSTCCCR